MGSEIVKSGTAALQTYLLPLSDVGAPSPVGSGTFISLPSPYEPYLLRFQISSISLVSRDGTLWCNVPPSDDIEFDRETFYPHKICPGFHASCSTDIKITKPGAYAFYLTYLPLNAFLAPLSTTKSISARYHFTVAPRFTLDDSPLPLDALTIQSVVSKWMGPFSTWDDKLGMIRAKGYNMVHFTPLQYRGDSNSPYSIYDQHEFDPEIFTNGLTDIEALVSSMRDKHHLLSMTDVVWNHTASNSAWLREHPEAGYSVKTAPHLHAAYELDEALVAFSRSLRSLGLPTILRNMDDLLKIMDGIKIHVLGALRLWEFYVVDVVSTTEKIVEAFKKPETRATPVPENLSFDDLCTYVKDRAARRFNRLGVRFRKTLDPIVFAGILKALLPDGVDVARVRAEAAKIMDEINLPLYREYDNDAGEILEQLFNRIKYIRLDEHGPRAGEINAKSPLADAYFTRVQVDGETIGLANNGWIWNGNPLIDFASSHSKAYLRREVIAWGDCVKLRYGRSPEDSPYLWEHMRKYTEICAKHFHAFRIDNCHSTPLNVGEYLLDCARKVNPDLYVVAELFTGSEDMDKLFVERLGINSLIREAMQAWSESELSRLVHRHGGQPVGSLTAVNLTPDKPVSSSHVHALFMDCTHDNETPTQKRTVEDTLPNAALVAMCSCATGSVLGYDECYPHLLDLVNEKRSYTFDNGIGSIKKVLNDVHEYTGKNGAEEMHVHHEGSFITVHRVNPRKGKGWFLIAHTKFNDGYSEQRLGPVVLQGTFARAVLSSSLVKRGEYKHSDTQLTGVPVEVVDLQAPTVTYDSMHNQTSITLPDNFPPGSIALIRTWIPSAEESVDDFVVSGAVEAVKDLNLIDLNFLMYRCDAEERDLSDGQDGVYVVPNFGPLVYAGLQGFMSPFTQIISKNDLSHPLCEHLRQGQWPLDYVHYRLDKHAKNFPNIRPLEEWFQSRFSAIRKVPSFLLPRYFAMVLQAAHGACRQRAKELLGAEFTKSHEFLQALFLCSVQMVGVVKSTSLIPAENVPCMAAGLPHFSRDYMRCWGRDVFLSLRGLLIVPGRYEEAKAHILAFASVLKHGMIPNLLDAGRRPRYNSRDSVWFFLQNVQDYVKLVPNGEKILSEQVKRRFPLDDTFVEWDDPRAYSYSTSLEDIIQEIFQRHAEGLHFREWNAGRELDMQMKDEGFNIDISVDWSNGLIFGGNQWNCGTWMDKMGESDRAGNKGWPGTPRDGAAVEISGMLKSALRWVNELRAAKLFKYDSVTTENGAKTVTFEEWEAIVQANFEKVYYVPLDPADDDNYVVTKACVNRRGIYKDLYRSGKEYEDYELRPNFAIAMTVAPELFTPEHALGAIAIADTTIRGPVGMATLDPTDLNYRPYYNNSEDSTDFRTAKGRNYHQGPEWLWCTGFFLRAFLHFDLLRKTTALERVETLQQIHLRLQGHERWIRESMWAGLTELTNKNSELCNDSSPTQAWSAATLVDLYKDVQIALGGQT
ncbi:glucanotransferase domain of glycogen debranching enzyme-domain-containing protein [Limtongia smithiae]|uniref:glucanotransferase domain of glycogen debranching enzyme-domain-containing protein n=1 Tax=Limtongia smithiae TaxID=1125753 RepID=UPI0034CEE82D